MVDLAQIVGAAARNPQVQQYLAQMLSGGTRPRLGQLPAASGPRISAAAPRLKKPTNTGDIFGQMAQLALMRKMMAGATGAPTNMTPTVAPAHNPGHEPSYRESVRSTVAPAPEGDGSSDGKGGESPYADKWADTGSDDDDLDRLRSAITVGPTVESYGGVDPWGGDSYDDGLLDRKPVGDTPRTVPTTTEFPAFTATPDAGFAFDKERFGARMPTLSGPRAGSGAAFGPTALSPAMMMRHYLSAVPDRKDININPWVGGSGPMGGLDSPATGLLDALFLR